MIEYKPITVLCISSLEVKGGLIRICKKEGCRVILITSQSLESYELPKESVDEIFYIPDVGGEWDIKDLIGAIGYLAKTEKIDKIIPVNECDIRYVEKINEHFQFSTVLEYQFTDILKQRNYLEKWGILVPKFIHALNYSEIEEFVKQNEFPLILKPRFKELYFKHKKIYDNEELWKYINKIGDLLSYYILEQFIAGVTYHVDSLVFNDKIIYSLVSQYSFPPLDVIPYGRVFTSKTILRGTVDEQNLLQLNKQVLKTINFANGIIHIEIIKADINGRCYLANIVPYVADEYLAEMFYSANGINLWREWAKIIVNENNYVPCTKNEQYAGLIFSNTLQNYPDLGEYTEEEIVKKIINKNEVAIIIASENYNKINELIKEYTKRFYNDFFVSEKIDSL